MKEYSDAMLEKIKTDIQALHRKSEAKNVGRNDPCPCGSGKKYKKCCLESQAPGAVKISEKQLITAEKSLLQKLVDFGNSGRMNEYQKRAFGEFFTGAEKAPKSFWTDEKEIDFMGWFTFDYRLPIGKRMIELFAAQESGSLTSLEEQLLQDWLPTAAGLYEVQEIERGRGMLLEDIVTGERFFVHDVSSSNTANRWELLLARIIPVGGIRHFAGYLMAFYPRDKGQLISLAKKEMRKYKKQHLGAGWPEMFLDRIQVFFQYGFQKQLNPVLPELTNFDGEPVELWKAVYDCRDFGQVKQILAKVPGLKTDDKAGLHEANYYWKEECPKKQTPGWTPLRGQITLKKDKLTVEVNSRSRMEQAKKLLLEHCGDLVAHRADTLTDIEALAKQAALEPGGRKSRSSSGAGQTEGAKQVVTQMMRDYYRNWLDQPIPALRGKTPRQESKTRTGRERVSQLLKEIEYGMAMTEQDMGLVSIVDEIRKELGID